MSKKKHQRNQTEMEEQIIYGQPETAEELIVFQCEFFRRMEEIYPDAQIIAEDLGDIDDDVRKLVKETGFPGMGVMQFAFITDDDTPHLPHNYTEKTVGYTGTHDNNTLLGWLWDAGEEERAFALDYCGFDNEDWGRGGYNAPACRKITEAVWRSTAFLAVIPFQDMCGFGNDARMNIPGDDNGNWRFRTTAETIDGIDSEYFSKINRIFRRK